MRERAPAVLAGARLRWVQLSAADLDSDNRPGGHAVDRLIAQPDGSNVAPVAVEVDGAGASPRIQHLSRIHILFATVFEANVEIAQMQRLVHRADSDRALSSASGQRYRITVASIHPGVTDRAPTALVPLPVLCNRRSHGNKDRSGGGGSQKQSTHSSSPTLT